jgi:hypothetical protein
VSRDGGEVSTISEKKKENIFPFRPNSIKELESRIRLLGVFRRRQIQPEID